MKRMKHIIITGSSGQIGTNLGEALLERGWMVTGLDCRGNSWVDSFPTIRQDLRKGVDGILEALLPAGRADCIVHLAANAKVHELVEHPQRAMDNITMAFNVFEAARRLAVPVVFASSREVYGDVMRDSTRESQADFSVAQSPYSASKISAEAMIYSYGRCYGLPHLVFRFSNVYGRYDSDLERMERVVPLFISRILAGEPVTIYGRCKTLDFTHVDDCVAGLMAGIDALLAGRISGEVINLAAGRGETLVDLAGYIGRFTGRRVNLDIRGARRGEIMRYVADLSKARRLLGYNPVITLEDGICRTLELRRGPEIKTSGCAKEGYVAECATFLTLLKETEYERYCGIGCA